MNTFKTITIQNITFESNDDSVLLKGIVNDQLLSYETDLIINFSQLNKLTNIICKNNESFSLNNYLDCQNLFDLNYLYTADLRSVEDTSIPLHLLQDSQIIREVRA